MGRMGFFRGGRMMSWEHILKIMDLGDLEDIFNNPIPDINKLLKPLVELQRSYPQMFRTNVNTNDIRGMVNQMLEEAELYANRTKQLEPLRIKEQLEMLSSALMRIEELE